MVNNEVGNKVKYVICLINIVALLHMPQLGIEILKQVLALHIPKIMTIQQKVDDPLLGIDESTHTVR